MTIRWGSRKQCATELGITRQRVEQYIAKGVIEETGQGIDLDAAKAAYGSRADVVRKAQFESVQSLKSGTAGPSAPAMTQSPVRETAAAADAADVVVAIDYNKERARREKANAELQEIRLQTERGRLIDRDEVKAREFAVARKLRDRILGFPAKIVNFVPPEAMKIITEECEVLIREMQDDAARIGEQSPG